MSGGWRLWFTHVFFYSSAEDTWVAGLALDMYLGKYVAPPQYLSLVWFAAELAVVAATPTTQKCNITVYNDNDKKALHS